MESAENSARNTVTAESSLLRMVSPLPQKGARGAFLWRSRGV